MIDIQNVRAELEDAYPGCNIVVIADKREVIAEVSEGIAIAVIERSSPHFHLSMQEVYRVQRGILYVACEGKGYVLRVGDTLTIEPGQVHYAQSAGDPAWIEVESTPPWSIDDHFVFSA